jgi:prevent-host-death family protein
MKSIATAAEARDRFSEIVNRAAYGKERIQLTRHGKGIVAVIPIEDLELLERLEEAADLQAAAKALAESDERVPYEEVRRKLGLS